MNNIIKGKKFNWELVVGIEVHAQISSNSKLFSSSPTKFGSTPNSQVSLVDAAMPGMLPVINEFCITQAIKTGLGLKAKINNKSIFDRKNYFYADLPQGYQISQYKHPIVGEGKVEIDLPDGQSKKIRIIRLHLEQDAGKSLHDQSPNKTYVDLNRSGIALMEIVSEPDLSSAEEAAIYINKLRTILRYLNTCDGNMQEGSLRADVNISVKKTGEKNGTRCEVKNLNSIKFIKQAINYEAKRQIDILEDGGNIEQNTLLFDSKLGITKMMRNKEEAHDYRYFPDPDLLPLEIEDKFISDIKNTIPELPDEKKQRYIDQYKLTKYDSSILISEKDTSEYFEKILISNQELKNHTKIISNWIISELFAYLKKDDKQIKQSPVSPENLGKLILLIVNNTISGKIAKEVFEEMYVNKSDPQSIIENQNLTQVTDTKEINKIIEKVLQNNQDKLSEYKNGKNKLFGFFVGQVMKNSNGKANPKIVNELLKEKLN